MKNGFSLIPSLNFQAYSHACKIVDSFQNEDQECIKALCSLMGIVIHNFASFLKNVVLLNWQCNRRPKLVLAVVVVLLAAFRVGERERRVLMQSSC